MESGPEEFIGRVVGLLDALNCGAAILRRDGRIVAANARLCEMAGRDREKLVGMRVGNLYHEAEGEAVIRDVMDHFEEPSEGEFYLPLRDGKKLPVVTSSKVLGGVPPLSDHRLVTMIDVTPQKEAEEGLREQYRIIAELSNTILGQAEKLKGYSEELEKRVRERTAELHAANLDAIYMLAVASEAKDEETGLHVRRIETLARALALELGMGEREAEATGYSAVLHDVGKMHVPDVILKKPGPLTAEERIEMQRHTVEGERMLSSKPFFERARRIARSHHENWDGSGYPDGTAGRAIPVEARIVHLADVYDALTSVRAYKAAWPGYRAAEVIREARGRMFDPDVVGAFEALYDKKGLGA